MWKKIIVLLIFEREKWPNRREENQWKDQRTGSWQRKNVDADKAKKRVKTRVTQDESELADFDIAFFGLKFISEKTIKSFFVFLNVPSVVSKHISILSWINGLSNQCAYRVNIFPEETLIHLQPLCHMRWTFAHVPKKSNNCINIVDREWNGNTEYTNKQ